MTLAWYGHLKFPQKSLWIVIIVSWFIAFVEYCFAVPANRIGYKFYSAAMLKTMQEVISISVFILFAYFYLGEKISLTQAGGFALICLGSYFVFSV